MANPDLPKEILLEIFARLPTKPVGRFRALSKYWNIHLSTNIFIKKHLITRQQTIQQENLALVTQKYALNIITSPTKVDEVSNDESGSDRWLFVLGSCNGLILLVGDGKKLLVNPITLKQVTIPPHVTPERRDLGYCDFLMDGLGYDSCSDDYKIVQLSSFKKKKEIFVDVYSVKNGVWKSLDGCYPYGGLVPSRYGLEDGAFVNGALHWLICSEKGYRSCIAAFDLANEVFTEIPLPKDFVRQQGKDVYGLARWRTNGVSVVGGCLLIVDNFGNGATDVWIMKEYGVAESWVKFRIETENGRCNSIVAILCYVEDGELLFLTSRGFLHACDLKLGTVRKVVLRGCDACFAYGLAFVDSLVSPEGSP